jgi:hypothetical protein
MRLPVAAAAVLAGLLAAGAPDPAGAQCAMCKTALTSSPEGRALSGQMNRAIIVMLFSPYIVAGTVAGVLFRRQITARVARLLQRR